MKTEDLSRRDFLGRSLAGLTGASLALAPAAHAAPRPRLPVGVQLYSVREQCARDLPGVLASLSKIGYRGVEFAGYYDRSAKELRKLLDDNGLVACGTHTSLDSLSGDELEPTIEFNQTLGNQFLIIPWMEGRSGAEWLERARQVNDIAAAVKPKGLATGYHAHAHDFQEFDGQTAWDIFFGNTRPEVIMQLDTSNCASGGADPVAVLKKYPGRARSIHLKAHGGGPETVIGEDKIDWTAVFDFCEGPGRTEWYVVEHESSGQPMDAVKRCFEALKRLGKV